MKTESTSQKPRLTACQEAEEAGVDMEMIEANLKRSPAERVQRHAKALSMALMFKKAGSLSSARSRINNRTIDTISS